MREGAAPQADRTAPQAVVVIGGSAGALDPLTQILTRLPGDVRAAFVVVVHTPATSGNHLARILGRHTDLRVETAEDGSRLEDGLVLVAPSDHHVVITPGAVRLTRSPRENGHRPAIDPLFRSAAQVFGRRVTGVVLCGLLDDGSAGLAAIKACGGTAMVHAPQSCEFSDMPENAIRVAHPDHVADAAGMASLIVTMNSAAVKEAPAMSDDSAQTTREPEATDLPGDDKPGQPSGLACPDCGGVLWFREAAGAEVYRCRIGHRFSPEALLDSQQNALEGAVWAAARALEEQAALSDRLQRHAEERGDRRSAERFEGRAETARRQAALVREAVGLDAPAQIIEGDATLAPR